MHIQLKLTPQHEKVNNKLLNKTDASLNSKFLNSDHSFWAQCYKTFYVRNLRIFVMSQTFCSLQAFPAYLNVSGQGQEPKLEWSTRKMSLVHAAALFTNNRLGRKCLPRTNNLAYYEYQQITDVKYFITLDPGLITPHGLKQTKKCFIILVPGLLSGGTSGSSVPNVIKLFTAVRYDFS